MKLILEVLQFLLTREISRLAGDYKAEIKNLMAANHLLGRVDYRLKEEFPKGVE